MNQLGLDVILWGVGVILHTLQKVALMKKLRPYDHYKPVSGIPDEISHKKRKPKSLAVVDSGNCTGCRVCVPFCPVDCIEVDSDFINGNSPINPVRVRYDECIGCSICASVCTKLTWDAIHMISLSEFEVMFPDVEITNSFSPDTAKSEKENSQIIEI